MGGGISIPAEVLANEDLVKDLQAEYAKQKEIFKDDETSLSEHMSSYYKNTLAVYVKPATAAAIESGEQRKSRPSSSDKDKKPAAVTTTATTAAATAAVPVKSALPTGKAKGRMEATRRRSFGPDANVPKVSAPTPAPAAAPPAATEGSSTILASASTSSLNTAAVIAATNTTTNAVVEPPPQIDSWESVSQQPYCTICQMAFKTPAFLERHIKYSDLHQQCVNKAAEKEKVNLTLKEKLTCAQEEGIHYKLLYSGTKFYWRSQENVDFSFYFHILPDCIEVIPFNVETNVEEPRLYFSYTVLRSHLQSEIAALVAKSKQDASSSNQPQPIDTSKADEDATRISITTYLLNRLQKSTGKNCEFQPTASDPINPQPPILLEKAPAVVVPVQVHRRRRTNAEEIDAAITAVENSVKSASEATGKATRIVDMMHEGIMLFVKTEKWWDKFNPIRKKWIFAIRKVIRRKLVMNATIYLENMNFKFYAKNPSPMKPKKPV